MNNLFIECCESLNTNELETVVARLEDHAIDDRIMEDLENEKKEEKNES